MQQGAVDIAALFRRCLDLVLRDGDQIVRAGIPLEQILECLAHHHLAVGVRDLAQIGELVEVVLDQEQSSA